MGALQVDLQREQGPDQISGTAGYHTFRTSYPYYGSRCNCPMAVSRFRTSLVLCPRRLPTFPVLTDLGGRYSALHTTKPCPDAGKRRRDGLEDSGYRPLEVFAGGFVSPAPDTKLPLMEDMPHGVSNVADHGQRWHAGVGAGSAGRSRSGVVPSMDIHSSAIRA